MARDFEPYDPASATIIAVKPPRRESMALAALQDTWFSDALQSADKLVAAFLHTFTASYSTVTLSITFIAQRVKLTEKTVRAAIRRLAELGEIRVIFGSGRRPHQYLPKFTEETYSERLKEIQNEGYSDRIERLLRITKRGSITAKATEIPPEEVKDVNRCPVNETAQDGRRPVNETGQRAADERRRPVNETGQRADSDLCPVNETADNKDSYRESLKPDSTLGGSVVTRARAREAATPQNEPLDIARELWRILGMVNQHSSAAAWHTSEIDVSRWLGAGATRDLILSVGRSIAARGKTNIPPRYLEQPIADAIAATKRPMPEPSKEAVNGQARPSRRNLDTICDEILAEARSNGGLGARKPVRPGDDAIDVTPDGRPPRTLGAGNSRSS